MAVNISYTKARFHRRCFACLLDFLFFALMFGLCFLSARAIVQSTPTYQSNETALLSIREESGMYHNYPETKRSIDIVSYIRDEGFDGYNKWKRSRDAIDGFIKYCGDHGYPESMVKVQKAYDDYRLDARRTYKDQPMFVRDESGNIVESQAFIDMAPLAERFEQAYAPFIDNFCQAYLVSEIPAYNELVHYESNMLFFAEMIPAYAVAGLLIYLLPIFIFRRGRMTFGKRLYNIATLDSCLLVPKMGRTMARFSIFYFGELLLTPFTFGVPLLISFSMMAFTKNRQSLPDYFLNLVEVDATGNKVYFDKAEIRLSDLPGMGQAPNFKSLDGLD